MGQGRWGRTLLLTALTAVAIWAGTAWGQTWDCGETPGTVTATLSGDTLTISGAGRMQDDYSPGALDGNPEIVTAVVIEEGVTYIGSGAFHAWVELASLTLPNTLTSIGRHAFTHCANLSTVTLPKSVISVQEGAFEDCKNLTNITIPSSTIFIGRSAFGSCPNLTTVTILNTIPPGIDNSPFGYEDKSTICLYVPISGIGAYLSANYWKDFTCIKVIASATVTFDSRGGSDIKPQTVLLNDNVPRPADPTHYGYTATGWYKDSTYSNEWNFDTDKVTEDITLYVKWQGSVIIAVTKITDIPTVIDIGSTVVLNGTVIPVDATNTSIVWNIVDTGATSAALYNGNRLVALSDGLVVLKATIVDGIDIGVNYERWFTIAVGSANTILFNDRVIPQSNIAEAVAIAPVARLNAKFTAGPNPAGSASNAVSFFWTGARITPTALYVYDAFGNAVKALTFRDTATAGKRLVGSWDLTDTKGRRVPNGAYLVKGAVKTANGKTERVSAVVAVR